MVEDADDARASTSLGELWSELSAAEAAVVAFGPTPEQLREEAAKAERMAKENGTPAKSVKVIQVLQHRWNDFQVLQHRWNDFLEVHGAAYRLEETDEPTIELAIHF